jgi:hypothetical protein
MDGAAVLMKFATRLAERLNNEAFNQGFDFLIRTYSNGKSSGSAEFIQVYDNCTNISVRHFHEHTAHEYQDLQQLAKVV